MGMQCYINCYIGVYIVVQYFDDFFYCFSMVSWMLGQFNYDYEFYLCVYDVFWWDKNVEVEMVVVWYYKVDVCIGEIMFDYLIGFWYQYMDDMCFVVIFMIGVQWLCQYLIVMNIGFYLFVGKIQIVFVVFDM